MSFLLLLIVGLAAGFLGSLVGLGGGIIVVPVLLFLGSGGILGNISPQVAVGTSLFSLIFTGLSSTLAYLKQKTVDYKSALLFLLGIAPGSLIGAWANQFLEGNSFNILFGILMIFMSFLLMMRNRLKPASKKQNKGVNRTYRDTEGKTYEYGYGRISAVLISFVVGFLSGIFGIGGGSLMVPVMLLLFHFPPHVAVGTSMLLIFLSSVIGSISHIAIGNVNWMYAFALIPGGWIGAKLGAYVNTKMKSATLVIALRIMLILVGIKLIWEGIQPLL